MAWRVGADGTYWLEVVEFMGAIFVASCVTPAWAPAFGKRMKMGGTTKPSEAKD
jgi:hypothetical protein